MSVAESTVTFGPIDHRGWLRACSTVTWSRSSAGWAQNGPPLAVMISRRTLLRCSPHRHCQIALCSESTGRMPRLPAAFITSPPAITSTSLVASATSFPASSAAIVGARARAPGMATTTRSHRGSVTIAMTRASKSGSPACPRIRWWVTVDDIERLPADRARGAEDGDVDWSGHLSGSNGRSSRRSRRGSAEKVSNRADPGRPHGRGSGATSP